MSSEAPPRNRHGAAAVETLEHGKDVAERTCGGGEVGHDEHVKAHAECTLAVPSDHMKPHNPGVENAAGHCDNGGVHSVRVGAAEGQNVNAHIVVADNNDY